MSKVSIAIVVAWFGETKFLQDWYISVIQKIPIVSRIIVIDQNRGLVTRVIGEKIDYFSVPRTTSFASLDHAISINQAVENISFSESHILITETDSIVLSSTLLNNLDDVSHLDFFLTANPGKKNESHPNFMLMKTECLRYLDFTEGLGQSKKESSSDTGRKVYGQLKTRGFTGILIESQDVYKGKFGYLYLYRGLNIWHVSSMSLRALSSVNDQRAHKFGLRVRQSAISAISKRAIPFSNPKLIRFVILRHLTISLSKEFFLKVILDRY